MAARKKETVLKVRSKKLVIAPSKKEYEKDFYKWVNKQANLLKNREFSHLDIENLIEEIESLGRSEKRTLKSYLENLLTHMLKGKFQPGMHTTSWDLSIKEAKYKAQTTLKENPSLKPALKEILKDAYFSARLRAALETKMEEKVFPKECPWKLNELFSGLEKKYL